MSRVARSGRLCLAVVVDDDRLAASTLTLLRAAGHRALGVLSTEAIDDEIAGEAIDVLLVDANLPQAAGYALVRRFREACPEAGVIMIGARDRVEARVRAYEHGADAWLERPIDSRELLALVDRLGLRLAAHERGRSGRGEAGLILDRRRLQLTGPEGAVRLTAMTANILAALSIAPGRRLETWRLFEAMGENSETYAKASLEVRITRLRRDIRSVVSDRAAPSIRSVRSFGYQLCRTVILI